MNAAGYRLADFFSCLAASVHETRMNRPALAETAWLEAHIPASDLFAYGTAASAAAGVLITAVRTDGNGDPVTANRLHNALDAAGDAAGTAVTSAKARVHDALCDAFAAAEPLPEDWRDAICTLLTPVILISAGVPS